LFKCVYNNDFPGISKKNEYSNFKQVTFVFFSFFAGKEQENELSCTTLFKIHNFSCTNFYKKNQPKYTTNGVLTDPSTNAILEK
jgi:hypothetical protein